MWCVCVSCAWLLFVVSIRFKLDFIFSCKSKQQNANIHVNPYDIYACCCFHHFFFFFSFGVCVDFSPFSELMIFRIFMPRKCMKHLLCCKSQVVYPIRVEMVFKRVFFSLVHSFVYPLRFCLFFCISLSLSLSFVSHLNIWNANSGVSPFEYVRYIMDSYDQHSTRVFFFSHPFC